MKYCFPLDKHHSLPPTLQATARTQESSSRSTAAPSTAAACDLPPSPTKQCRATSRMAASTVVIETGTGTGTGMKQTGAGTTTTTATEERAEAGTAHVMAVIGKAGCQVTVPHTPLHNRMHPTSAACCRDHRSSGRDGRSSQGTTPTKPAGSGPPAAGPPAAAAGTKPPAAVGRGLLGSK